MADDAVTVESEWLRFTRPDETTVTLSNEQAHAELKDMLTSPAPRSNCCELVLVVLNSRKPAHAPRASGPEWMQFPPDRPLQIPDASLKHFYEGATAFTFYAHPMELDYVRLADGTHRWWFTPDSVSSTVTNCEECRGCDCEALRCATEDHHADGRYMTPIETICSMTELNHAVNVAVFAVRRTLETLDKGEPKAGFGY